MQFCPYAKWRALAITILAVFSWRCGPSHPSHPSANVVIISIDTLRADRLSAYGGDYVKTPAMDRLFADSVLFEKAFAQCPLTLPSHATVFTGLLPTSHGVRDNLSYQLDEDHFTLAEQLQAAGYETGGFVSAMVLGRRTGIAQGFNTYDSDLIDGNGQTLSERPGQVALDHAKAWLDQLNNEPFLMFLHFYEPHAPYEPPEPFDSEYANDYDGEIAYVDRLVGHVIADLKRRNLYDNSLIVLMSDHGEGLGDHGELEHGVLLYREAVQVPLSLKLPNSDQAGRRVADDVGLMDIMPTVQRLLGIETTAGDGVSLLDGKRRANRMIYSESYYPRNGFGYSPLRSVVQSPHHYIESTREELYNWEQDPRETENLLPDATLPERLPDYLATLGEGLDRRSASTSEDLEMLASLGYTAVVGTPVNNSGRDIDELVEDLTKLKYAKDLVDRGEYGVGEGIYRELLERNPCLHEVRLRLAEILRIHGADDELEKLYDDGLACDPRHIPFLMLTIHHKIKLDKIDEAMTLTQFAWEVAPLMNRDELSFFFYSGGEEEKAVNLARNVLKEQADMGFSNFVLGKDALNQEALQAARQRFESAAGYFQEIQNAPMRRLALYELGQIYAGTGRGELAVAAYRDALAAVPNEATTRQALAKLLAQLGRQRDAIVVMDQWVRDFPSKNNYRLAAETMRELGVDEAAQFYRQQSQQYD